MAVNIHRIRVITFSALVCLMFISGCSDESPKNISSPSNNRMILKIGLIPEQNIFNQLSRYKNLGDYLEKKTGTGIEFKILTRYGSIVTDFNELKLDGAFFGSFTYAIAHSTLGVIPVARPENPDGTSTYHGLIFTRNDSGIIGIDDMKGKIFAFVDKATTAGYLLPLAYFKNNSISDYNNFFKKTYFTGTHEDAVYDVLNKFADVGAAKNTVFYRLAQKDPRITNELRIISRSPDVPENGLALRKGIEETVENKIREALLNMHHDTMGKIALQAFGAARFVETTDDDYQSVYGYACETGLDLSSYDYTDD